MFAIALTERDFARDPVYTILAREALDHCRQFLDIPGEDEGDYYRRAVLNAVWSARDWRRLGMSPQARARAMFTVAIETIRLATSRRGVGRLRPALDADYRPTKPMIESVVYAAGAEHRKRALAETALRESGWPDREPREAAVSALMTSADRSGLPFRRGAAPYRREMYRIARERVAHELERRGRPCTAGTS